MNAFNASILLKQAHQMPKRHLKELKLLN